MHSILRHNMENANVKTVLSIAGLNTGHLACHDVHEGFYQRSRLLTLSERNRGPKYLKSTKECIFLFSSFVNAHHFHS